MKTDWVAVEKLLMHSSLILHALHANLLRQVFSIRRIATRATAVAGGDLPACRPASMVDKCLSS